MRRAARVIVIKDGNLLVMTRNKFGSVYHTLPGGHVDIGETPEQTAIRETIEETSIEVSQPRLVFLEHAGPIFGDQYVYLCDYVSGEPKLLENSEEYRIHQMGKNLYEPKWFPISEIPDSPFVSDQLKDELLKCLNGNWPEKPKEFTSTRSH